MNKQTGKVSLIIILTVIVLIAAGGLYFLQQKTSERQETQVSEPTINNANVSEAINLLKTVPEIKIIEDAVIKSGRKPFFTSEGESGDIITVSLRESFPDDPHTTRIDTFNVNINTKEIIVSDYVTNNDIPLDEWKKTVKERFQ